MNRISNLQQYGPKDWQGLTTKNHLGKVFLRNPIIVSDTIDRLFDMELGDDLDRFMDQFPYIELNEDEEFEWMLQGSEYKNVPLVEAYDEAGNAPGDAGFERPGVGLTTFFVVFQERFFEATDLIIGEDTEAYQLRVKDVKPKGTDWEYEVQLVTGDYQLFVPIAELRPGVRWSKEYSLVEQTLSKRGGTVSHTSPFKMRNRCSMIRKEYEVPGNMIESGKNQPVAWKWKTEKGKTETLWINYLDWKFMKEFKREKSILTMYAQSNKGEDGTYSNFGDSGYEIKQGAGLLAQVAPSNVFYYNDFSLDYLGEILLQLSIGKLKEDSRKFVLGTGEYGYYVFHKALEERGLQFSANNAGNRVSGTGNNLKLQGQFVEWGFINGIEVGLMKIPHFDDPVREKKIHPDGGLVKSREFLIMDFGSQEGKPNIQKVKVKGAEMMYRYIPGLRDPFSAGGKGSPEIAASSVDGYKVMVGAICGVKVHNPLRMARLIPNVL